MAITEVSTHKEEVLIFRSAIYEEIQEMAQNIKIGDAEVLEATYRVGATILLKAGRVSCGDVPTFLRVVYNTLNEARERAEKAKQCLKNLSSFLENELMLLEVKCREIEEILEKTHRERLTKIEVGLKELKHCHREKKFQSLSEIVELFGGSLKKLEQDEFEEAYKNKKLVL